MLVLYDAARVAGGRNRKSSSLLLPRLPHAADCSSARRRATTSTITDRRTRCRTVRKDLIGSLLSAKKGAGER